MHVAASTRKHARQSQLTKHAVHLAPVQHAVGALPCIHSMEQLSYYCRADEQNNLWCLRTCNKAAHTEY
jgi:hypothetical protein